MSELLVMKYNRIIMAIVGIYPYSFASVSLNLFRSISPYLITIILITCEISAATYAYHETSPSLMLAALSLVIGGIQSLCAYQNMRWKMDAVGQVHVKLQEIVDQSILFSWIFYRVFFF